MNDVELRCTCAKRVLLGIARHTPDGWVLHVKVFKQKRLYAEIIADSGFVKVRCRECLRWHSVRIRREAVDRLPKDSTQEA